MPPVVCFLRAVNVGGRRTTNDALVAAAHAGGYPDAVAYQAAGNLVVEAGTRSQDDVAAAVERAVADHVGFTAEVVVRDLDEVAAAVAGAPWTPAQVENATGKPQVVLCRRAPSAGVRDDVLALATDDDLLTLVGRDLHWLPIVGTGRSALDTTTLHELLFPATSRTTGTLDRIRRRFGPG